MTPGHETEHYIPVRVTDLVSSLCHERSPLDQSELSSVQAAGFRTFAEVATRTIHNRYLDELKRLKDAYAPFDPDSDTIGAAPESPEDRHARLDDLFATFARILERANYHRMTREELDTLSRGASEWGVDMHVTWEAFDHLDVYVRGRGMGRRIRQKWYRLFRKESVSIETFSRVAVILKQKPHKRLGRDADTRNVFLKLFKDIPQIDIEMLLPGTRIRMPILDRIKLGGTGIGSLGYVGWKLGTTFSFGAATGAVLSGSMLGLMTLYGPLALIVGYGYRTYASFQKTQQTYMLQLAQSLYFQNLDSNAGVLYRMLDAAEEQEAREMILAYYYLWRYAGERGWSADDLRKYIQLSLSCGLKIEIDFEIEDAIRTLERSGLLMTDGDRYRVYPLEESLARLDRGP